MGISIYYQARRPNPLSHDSSAIARVIAEQKSSPEPRAESEHEWKPRIGFNVYDSPADFPDVIFEGATELPMDSPDETWVAVQHWCALLSEIRKILPDTVWDVHVDDHAISWDAVLQQFDPTK